MRGGREHAAARPSPTTRAAAGIEDGDRVADQLDSHGDDRGRRAPHRRGAARARSPSPTAGGIAAAAGRRRTRPAAPTSTCSPPRSPTTSSGSPGWPSSTASRSASSPWPRRPGRRSGRAGGDDRLTRGGAASDAGRSSSAPARVDGAWSLTGSSTGAVWSMARRGATAPLVCRSSPAGPRGVARGVVGPVVASTGSSGAAAPPMAAAPGPPACPRPGPVHGHRRAGATASRASSGRRHARLRRTRCGRRARPAWRDGRRSRRARGRVGVARRRRDRLLQLRSPRRR